MLKLAAFSSDPFIPREAQGEAVRAVARETKLKSGRKS